MSDEPWAYAKLWGKYDGKEIAKYVTALPAKIGRLDPSKSCTEPGFIDLGSEIKGVSRHHATIDWVPDLKKYRIQCFGKNGMVVGGKWRGLEGMEILSSRTAIKLGPCCMYFLLPEEGSQQSSQNPSDHDRPLSGPALEAAQLHQQAVQADYSRQQRLIAQHQSTQDASKSDSSSVAASHQENNQSTPASSTLRSRGVPPHAVTGKSYVELTMDAFESEELREISQRLGGLTSAEITGWAVAQYPDVFTSAEPRKALSTGVQGVLARRGEKGPIAPGKKGARWNLRESGAVKKRKVDSIDGSGAKNIEKKDESERQIHQYINEFEDDAGSGGEYMPNYRYRGRNSFDSHNASYQDSNV